MARFMMTGPVSIFMNGALLGTVQERPMTEAEYLACTDPAAILGDEGVNNRDCASKGRHPDAIIKPEQVAEIRARLAAGGRGIGKQLAEEYGVSPLVISRIRTGKTWGCIP